VYYEVVLYYNYNICVGLHARIVFPIFFANLYICLVFMLYFCNGYNVFICWFA
jgi:hypothetical protein